MDTIKKVLHPKESAHHKDNHTSSSQQLPPDARPDQETLDRLGDEPNVTGTNRPPPHEDFPPTHNHHTATTTTTGTATGDQPKINRGHHHPRQPVGATGTPSGHGGAEAGAGTAAAGTEAGAHDTRARAEEGNNFPGTNPDPAHSA